MRSLRLVSSLRLGAGLLLAGAAVLSAASPARADATVDGSWWSQLNTGLPVSLPVAVPTLPAVSPDLMVQEVPNGPIAVAAIRLPVPDGTVPTNLTVRFATPAAAVALAGCATVFTWASTLGGTWDARPTCNGDPVPLTIGADGTTGTLDLTRIDQTSIARDGVVQVLLAPAAGSTAFTASLDPPATTDLTTRAAAPSTGTGPVATAAAVAAIPSDTAKPRPTTKAGRPVAAAAATHAAVPAAVAAPLAAPAAVGPAPATAVIAAPLVEAATASPEPGPLVATDLPAAAPALPAAQPVAAASVGLTHTNRRLPALLLLLIGLLAATALPMRTRVPVLLTSRGSAGSPSTPEVPQAGLGRHRSPRTGRPPRL